VFLDLPQRLLRLLHQHNLQVDHKAVAELLDS
jgi:hypothetical protein